MNTFVIFPPRRLRLSSMVALAMALVCAAPATSIANEAEAKIVKERAEQFWNARVQDQWDVVFDLMPPEEQALAKDRDTFNAFNKDKGWFKYTSATVGEAVVSGNLAWVEVSFTSTLRQYPTMPPQESKVWDLWLRRDDWRPVPRGAVDQFPTRPPTVRSAEDEALLTKAIHVLWEARQNQDWAAVYGILDPAFRKNTSRDDFLKRKSRYLYLSHKIDWVEANGARAKAKIIFSQKLNDPTLHKLDPEDQVTYEQWVKVDGQWFRLMEAAQGSQ